MDYAPSKRDVLSGALGLSLAASLPGRLLAQGRDGITIAYPVDVQSWDPTSVTFPAGQSIFKCVFDQPLTFSPKHELLPRIVKSWGWADGSHQRLNVELRDDVTFHDGSKLTTEDMKYSLVDRPQADKKLAAAGLLSPLNGMEIVSPTKGVLLYGAPNAAAPLYLAFLTAYILPKAYHEKVGAEGFLAKPVGAGPYRLVDYQRGSRIVLEAHDGYWGGKAAIRNVTFQIMPEPSTRVAAVEAGRAEVAIQLPIREAARLEKDPKLNVKIYPQAEIFMLQMPSYVEALRNEDLRNALHLAINKEALSRAFFNGVAKPISILSVPGSAEDDPSFKIASDPKRAAELLKKAGYGPDKPLEITFLCTNGTWPNDFEMARAIAAMWKAIGVQAKIEETTVGKYLDLNHNAKLPGIMLYSWANPTGDPDNTSGRILDPRLRFSAWKDPALTDRMAKLLSMPLGEPRLEAYRALLREASEKSWSIPLLQTVGNVVSTKAIEVPTYEAGYILPAEFKTA